VIKIYKKTFIMNSKSNGCVKKKKSLKNILHITIVYRFHSGTQPRAARTSPNVAGTEPGGTTLPTVTGKGLSTLAPAKLGTAPFVVPSPFEDSPDMSEPKPLAGAALVDTVKIVATQKRTDLICILNKVICR
jgi:hypothetical protein